MQVDFLNFQNFTVFHEASFEFIPGINVFIGENGTGKTHLLKSIYVWTRSYGYYIQDLKKKVFQIDTEDNLKSFQTKEKTPPVCEISISPQVQEQYPRPVFIPAMDMLAHTRFFVSTFDEYNIDFDQTYRDIVALLESPEKRELNDFDINLSDITNGFASEIEEENNRFYITTPQGRFAAPMMAEGIRKLATLVQLIKNGWIRPGSVLLWDEPEVNLNPILLSNLAKALLKLAEQGVQIFLATHSYVFLQELDLQASDGQVRYFALEQTDHGVVPHPSDSYDALKPNKISEAFDSIYDRMLTKSIRRPRKNANGR
jgi:predicted ATP-dependent endonuclease of OLD family